MIRRPPRSTLFPTRRSSDLGDGVDANDVPYMTTFPYQADPFSGFDNTKGEQRSEEHTSELQSPMYLVCRLLLEKKKKKKKKKKNTKKQQNKKRTTKKKKKEY